MTSRYLLGLGLEISMPTIDWLLELVTVKARVGVVLPTDTCPESRTVNIGVEVAIFKREWACAVVVAIITFPL